MKKSDLFGTFILIWLSCNAGLAQNNQIETRGNIAYQISVKADNPKIAYVKADFTPKDSILYMSQGAADLPDRWATFVHKLVVTDSKGETVEVEDLQDAMWKLPSETEDEISLSYELHLDHEQQQWSGGLDGVAYSTDWGVFYTTRALLILHSDNWEDIRVDFTLPDPWKVSTPWQPLNKRKTSFKVPSQASLMQSMLFAGTHRELSFKREDFELIFALGGSEVLKEESLYKDLANGVLDYYIEIMGGLPNPPPDNPLEKAVVIINTADQTDGEVIGTNISIMLEEGGDAMSKMISRFIFAHEFFHLWNGKSIVPDDQETEWFKEGFTNYYTLKALRQVGLLDDNAFYQVLNNLFYQRYINDSGLGSISMTQGEEKHDHWGIIYGGGLFVAMAQDAVIREASGNSRSIDDLMRSIFKKYGGTHEHYTIDDVLNGLTELSGEDQSPFLKKYIRGKEPIPIEDYLPKVGIKAQVSDKQLLLETAAKATKLQSEMRLGVFGQLEP
ncbi:M61 family metallopeptidase [Poritiphilus flavus]|uniref:Peptidase M61 catalytic domain-containing protein n=1 Tax=Poritiphilus flavus TaxID=2697053 RepID=A0A6L9EG05_9FLAO|nr:M1 family aminopeptidase [Poritiphilus flavus]NAS13665.1 hypothetical protein [Poritiphilus flavus]